MENDGLSRPLNPPAGFINAGGGGDQKQQRLSYHRTKKSRQRNANVTPQYYINNGARTHSVVNQQYPVSTRNYSTTINNESNNNPTDLSKHHTTVVDIKDGYYNSEAKAGGGTPRRIRHNHNEQIFRVPFLVQLILEALSVLILVLFVNGSVVAGIGVLAVSISYSAVIVMILFLSGGTVFINPVAVLIATFLGEIRKLTACITVAVQFAGGIGGGALLFYIHGSASDLGTPRLSGGVTLDVGILIEALITIVVFGSTFVAGLRNNNDTSSTTIVVTVRAASTIATVLFSFTITGAGLNIARVFGSALFSAGGIGSDVFRVYLVGSVVGGAVIVVLYWLLRWLTPSEDRKTYY